MCISLHGLGKFFRFTGVQNFFSKISLLGDSAQNHRVHNFILPLSAGEKIFQKRVPGTWVISLWVIVTTWPSFAWGKDTKYLAEKCICKCKCISRNMVRFRGLRENSANTLEKKLEMSIEYGTYPLRSNPKGLLVLFLFYLKSTLTWGIKLFFEILTP